MFSCNKFDALKKLILNNMQLFQEQSIGTGMSI